MSFSLATALLQLLNFGISLYVLRRWLFRPVMAAMEARKKRIEAEFADAERLKKEAEAVGAALDKERLSFERQRDRLREEEEKRLAAESEETLREFEETLAKRRALADEQMNGEREAFIASAAAQSGRIVLEIAARAVKSLTSQSLEESVVLRLSEIIASGRMEGMRELEKFFAAERKLEIRASFPLTAKQKSLLKTTLAKALRTRVLPIRFARSSTLLCGVEIICGDLELRFGIDNYIDMLRENVDKHS
ncbi:MAG: hypothetical protein LBL52_01950 [Rickettsiales bacterium]|jgi:F-type H+-transporting ATPase subunit b|nr:hypothetical protein [Rickettsiales bacterium]